VNFRVEGSLDGDDELGDDGENLLAALGQEIVRAYRTVTVMVMLVMVMVMLVMVIVMVMVMVNMIVMVTEGCRCLKIALSIECYSYRRDFKMVLA
jgi:carbon starvation protein CstA